MQPIGLPLTPPAYLLPWLTYVKFLTEKLQTIAGDATLEVINQHWERPTWWDCYVLQLTETSVLHREILMHAHQQPCWYARTIIPESTYQADVKLFDRLNRESLGNLIFQGNKIQRASICHYAIDAKAIEYHWLTQSMHQQASVLWARLSEFQLKTKDSFFLIEILLPGLEQYINRTSS